MRTNYALEATPIVVDGTMFVSGSWSVVYALDAATGEEKWVFDPELRLRWIRYGVLSDLVRSGRRRPAAPSDEPDSGAPSADGTRNEFPD